MFSNELHASKARNGSINGTTHVPTFCFALLGRGFKITNQLPSIEQYALAYVPHGQRG